MSSKLAITKLGESNYKAWKTDIVDILSCENLWFVVSGEEAAPAATASAAENLKWEERRLMATATLRLSMEKDIRARYADEKYFGDPVELWTKIEEDYAEVVSLDEFSLRTQLFELRLEDKGTVTEYLADLDRICGSLLTCGTIIDAKERWFYTTRGLPASWGAFSQITKSVLTKDLASLNSRLLAEESRLRREQGIGPDTALFVPKKGSTPQASSAAGIECYHCHKKGHRRRDCRIRLASIAGGSKANPVVQAQWIVGGGTNHVTGTREHFISYTPYDPGEHRHQVRTANNTLLEVAGHGDIEVAVWKPGGTSSHMMQVQSVLHIPAYRGNLLSASQLGRAGMAVQFSSKGGEIHRGGKCVGEMVVVGGLYLLRSQLVPPSVLAIQRSPADIGSSGWEATETPPSISYALSVFKCH